MGSALIQCTAWHLLHPEEALRLLDSRRDGLRSKDARQRLEKLGFNEIPDARRRRPLGILWGQLRSPFLLILGVAMTITLFLRHYFDMAVIATAVSVNVIIGFMQEYHAERALDSLRKINAPKSAVLRDGVHQTISTREIVPGDIVVLERGTTLPADGRVIEAHALQI